jgi:hypothetical protein
MRAASHDDNDDNDGGGGGVATRRRGTQNEDATRDDAAAPTSNPSPLDTHRSNVAVNSALSPAACPRINVAATSFSVAGSSKNRRFHFASCP